MDGAEIGVFEDADQVSFRGLLEDLQSESLEAKILFEIMGDFSDESLEGQLADEGFCGLLVSAYFAQSDGAGSVSVGSLDPCVARFRPHDPGPTNLWRRGTCGQGGELYGKRLGERM